MDGPLANLKMASDILLESQTGPLESKAMPRALFVIPVEDWASCK